MISDHDRSTRRICMSISRLNITENLSPIRLDTGRVYAMVKCICDCGKEIVMRRDNLRRVFSCGCLRDEVLRSDERRALIIKVNRKLDPKVASAKMLYKDYKRNDKNISISFEEFYELCSRDCYYCGIAPYAVTNCFTNRESSQSAKELGGFVFNGLDKIIPKLGYRIDNVNPCCITCNMAKSDKTLEEFYNYIGNLNIKDINKVKIVDLPKVISILKIVYRRYLRRDSNMNITLKEFYSYTQSACHYCGVYGYSLEGKVLHYNGLDRIDSSGYHTIDNIVPCCGSCNFAKNDLSVQEFNTWINRIKIHQSKK